MADHPQHGTVVPGLAAPKRYETRPMTDECPGLAGGGAFNQQTNRKICHCANPEAQCKRFATLRAKLALAGHELIRTNEDDGPVRFYAGRWGCVRELRDVAAVHAFAAHVGVRDA